MSKQTYLIRYSLILEKLKAKPYASFEELSDYIENKAEIYRMKDDRLEMAFSKRTFQRDIDEIKNLLGCHIEYSKQRKGYYITSGYPEDDSFRRMMDAFNLFNSLTFAKDIKPFICLEKRRPQGTENIYRLIDAIKKEHKIRFSYHKFWEEKASERHGDPYALKEFRDRWYVLVKDNKDNKIKTFALDRLARLKVTRERFQRPKDFNVHENYRYYFGIITPEGLQPEDIILSFDPVQGKYIKTLPLHETQRILVDHKDEVRVKLKLCITQDLIMELLSFGNRMKVLGPEWLAGQIKQAHYEAYKSY